MARQEHGPDQGVTRLSWAMVLLRRTVLLQHSNQCRGHVSFENIRLRIHDEHAKSKATSAFLKKLGMVDKRIAQGMALAQDVEPMSAETWEETCACHSRL